MPEQQLYGPKVARLAVELRESVRFWRQKGEHSLSFLLRYKELKTRGCSRRKLTDGAGCFCTSGEAARSSGGYQTQIAVVAPCPLTTIAEAKAERDVDAHVVPLDGDLDDRVDLHRDVVGQRVRPHRGAGVRTEIGEHGAEQL